MLPDWSLLRRTEKFLYSQDACRVAAGKLQATNRLCGDCARTWQRTRSTLRNRLFDTSGRSVLLHLRPVYMQVVRD